MPVRPMLEDIELQHVQKIEVDGDQVLVQHGVPALEGDFLQRLGRRGTQITITGVLTGPEAGDGLKNLRDKFRAAEPVSFIADIAAATQVDQVLIEEMGVRELAGKPGRFEYAFTLREFTEPVRPEAAAREAQQVDENVTAESTEIQETVESQIEARQGTLEVTVEPSEPNTDLSHFQIHVQGQTEDGQDYAVVLDQQTNGVFRKTDMPAGQYTITLQVT